MTTTQTKRTLGIKLALLALTMLIVGLIAYTTLYGIRYLTNNPANLLALMLAISAFIGLFQMKKWGATLTAITAAYNIAIQMVNLQYAYNLYPDLTLFDYVTAIAIPIASLVIGSGVETYVFKQIFANKFNPKTAQNQQTKQKRTYLVALISAFFAAYEFTWIAIDPSISAFKVIVITFAFISIVSILSLKKWGAALAAFTSVLFLFRFASDLQWTILYGSSSLSTESWYGQIITLEIIGIVLVTLQINYIFRWLYNSTKPDSAQC
jgi:hypothetical protein